MDQSITAARRFNQQPRDVVHGLMFYTGLLEGGIAVAMLLGTYALLQLPLDLYVLLLAGCATALVYLGERFLARAPEDAYTCPARVDWLERHRRLVGGLAALLVIGSGIGISTLRLETLVVGGLLGLIGTMYIVPAWPHRQRLKAHPWGKLVAISAAWAVGGVIVPVVEAGVIVTGQVFHLLVYRWCFVLPNVLLADWPDRAGDARAGLQTLATRHSLSTLQAGAVACLSSAIVGGSVALIWVDRPWLWLLDLVGYGLMLGVIVQARVDAGRAYTHLLDVVVAWPAVTALGAWMIGHL